MKNLRKCIFRAPRRASFHIFLRFHSIVGDAPRYLLKFTWMINLSSVQHLRWSSLWQKNCLVCKRVSTPPFQNHPTITRFRPFFKISHPPRPHSPTLPINWSSQVFLTNRNAAVKFSSINTIHVKQQCWLFHFQVHSKVHARWCLY